MRQYVRVLAEVCLMAAVAAPGRAEDASAARAIIQKAIKAEGGEARLTKYKAGICKSKVILYGMGAGDLSCAQETAVQFPRQCRMALTSDILKKTTVVNGDQGWVREDDQTEELTGDELAYQQEALYASWVASLVPLKDNAFTLVALGESKVGDRAAEGVKVTRKGHADVKLYFDKKTGRLLKTERSFKSPRSGEELIEEVLFSKFQAIDGVLEPMKVTVLLNGNRSMEEEIFELRHLEKLDDKVFAKP